MRRAHTILAVALVGASAWATPARAQIPVIDAENLVSNTLTSVMQTWNTIEAVLQTAMLVLELAGIDELADNGGLEGDLNTLVMLVEEGAAVAWDLQSITRQVKTLFDLDTAPGTTYELAQRQYEIRRTLNDAYTTAVRVQTLIKTAQHTVVHIKKLLDRVSGFSGNMQANQNINESLASLKRLEATQTATNVAYQRAITLQALEKPLVEESVEKIKATWCGRWCEGR